MDRSYSEKDIIIKILLIIVIIILILHNCSLINTVKKNNKKQVPTKNIDIFEIDCKKDTCESNNNNHMINPNTSSNDTSKPVSIVVDNKNNNDSLNSDNDENEKDKSLIIKDKNIIWSSTNKLKIFTSKINNGDKIAPEDSNEYEFIIKNNTDYTINYSITFVEINNHNINIKYKLKKNNEYIVSDYSDYSNLNIDSIIIKPNSSDTYYLDWKWIGSSNDNNKAGISDAYNLSIKIEAESIDE